MQSTIPLDAQELAAITERLAARARSDNRVFLIIACAALIMTPLLVVAAALMGMTAVLALVAVIIILVVVALRPITGFYLVALCALIVEEDQPPFDILTNRLAIFYWPPGSALEGFVERPIGLLIIYVFCMLIARNLVRRQPLLRFGALFPPFLFFLLCAVGGALHGLATGGSPKLVVVAFRPLWYLFLTYLLAVNLVTQRKHVSAFLWIAILGAGVKAFQGIYIILRVTHGFPAGHTSILSHEDSFFFISALVLVMLYSIYYHYRPQLTVALLLSPAYIISLVANDRRADYVAFLLGAGVVVLLILYVEPRLRLRLTFAALVCGLLCAGYVLAFAQSNGALGKPARSIVSVFSSNTGNMDIDNSNLYRDVENFDLLYTVRQNPVLGLGFGKPYDQPEPLASIIPQLADTSNILNYVPHNNIYWIFMSLGPLGYFAMWFLLGAVIIKGCVLARHLQDPYLRLFAIFVVAVIFMEVTVAFADYQLFLYRNVFFVGLVAGILVTLPAVDGEGDAPGGRPGHASSDGVLNRPG